MGEAMASLRAALSGDSDKGEVGGDIEDAISEIEQALEIIKEAKRTL